MSIVQHAAGKHFESEHSDLSQLDVLCMQWQFFRLLFPSEATMTLQEIHVGKESSTIQVTVHQQGKDCMTGFLKYVDTLITCNADTIGHSMGNLALTRTFSFDAKWRLDPPPAEASVDRLSADADPKWISYLTPFHPKSFRRVQSYLKFFVPLDLQEPQYRDQWITPSDPDATFTNELLPFVADLSLPILDNYYPDESDGGQAATVAAGLQQKLERESNTTPVVDATSGSYEAPAMIMTLSSTFEIKKRLPEGGVRWLFMRARAKHIENSMLSMEVVILDQGMHLVLLSQQLCPIVDLSRAKRNKQKL